MTDDQPSRLTPDFMAGVLSGYLMGNEAGYRQAEADMDRAWEPAYNAAMATAKATPDARHWAAVRARQLAARKRHQVEARPWPDEVTP